MTKEELRAIYMKYHIKATFEEKKTVMEVMCEFLLNVTLKQGAMNDISNRRDGEGRLVMQMIMSKLLKLRSDMNGVSFMARNGNTLNPIIDPTLIGNSVRNIFETVCMFHIVYRNPSTDDEKTIVYLLWVIAGLNYRQRFLTNIRSEENFKKHEFEKNQIEEFVRSIKQTSLYNSLNDANRAKILSRIESKEYLIRFKKNKIICLKWHEVPPCMGMRPELFTNMYTYFSLYAHPSNVSVFQFGDLFEKNERPFMGKTELLVNYAIILSSSFIADYIKVYPVVLKWFEELPLHDQIIINSSNNFARGDNYSINNCLEALN